MHSRPSGRGRPIWAFAMLSQQGVRAPSEGTDGANSFLPWFTIQTDRERNKGAGDSTTEGNAIIEIAKKTSKKKKRYCFKVEEIPKIGSTKGQTVHQHSQEDEKEQKIEYLLVCPKIHLFE